MSVLHADPIVPPPEGNAATSESATGSNAVVLLQ
jgi:hypothetical protein